MVLNFAIYFSLQNLQVQRHIQLRIEAQGKYLQSVLEKAQETLGRQNLGTVGLEAAKVQLSELVSKLSTQCLNSAFAEMKELQGICPQQQTLLQTTQPTDCSMDSCLTCDGSTQKDQDIHNTSSGMVPQLRPNKDQNHINAEDHHLMLQQSSNHHDQLIKWCHDHEDPKETSMLMISNDIIADQRRSRMLFPVERSSCTAGTGLSISIHGGEQAAGSGSCSNNGYCDIGRMKGRDTAEDDNFFERISSSTSGGRVAVDHLHHQINNDHHHHEKAISNHQGYRPSLPNYFAAAAAAVKLDLNAHDHENDSSSSCKQFDLNGISWS